MSIATFIDPKRLPYPFCPGCSHGRVLDALNEALVRLELDPAQVVIVTDIGCVGLSDQWFITHAFHGLHGRSVAYGQGLKLAAPDLHVIVLMGDGGAGIGGHHLLNAARRNVGITTILFNNFNFGMTGGEHSVSTPHGSITATTAQGHMERPLKLAETLQLNGAAFVARRADYDKDLCDVIERAIRTDGFAFVEVMEFCAAYYVPMNKFRRREMEALLVGPLPRVTNACEDAREYTRACQELRERCAGEPVLGATPIEPRFEHVLEGDLDAILAGSAGMKLRSATSLFARAAILSGLWASQRDDYPVTVMTGHFLSFLKLSAHPIAYLGVDAPDPLFILSPEGWKKAAPYLARMEETRTVYLLAGLPDVQTRARVVRVDLARLEPRVPREFVGIVVLSAFLKERPLFPDEAWHEAIRRFQHPGVAEKALKLSQAVTPAVFV